MRICYSIMETVTNENGEYIPCIVKEGESGYFKTDWLWGKDIKIARQCAKEKNEGLELTPEDVQTIIASSMVYRGNDEEKLQKIMDILGETDYVAGAYDEDQLAGIMYALKAHLPDILADA